MNVIGYLKNKGIKRAVKVLWSYKIDIAVRNLILPFCMKKPLQDVIMIESHNDFDCNGGAFYEYLIEHGFNKKYKIVWVIKNRLPRKNELPENVVCVPLYKPSLKKDYYLCNAKYLLADCDIFHKMKKEQISVYCSHGGVSFKNVQGLIVVPDEVDYVLCSSEEYAPLMCKNFSVPYPSERVVNIGFPSNDILFDTNRGDISKVTSKTFAKVVLWLPTFRKSKNGREDGRFDTKYGVPIFDTKEQLVALNAELVENNVLLVVKYHPMQDMSNVDKRSLSEFSNIVFLDAKSVKERKIDVFALMKDSDALISDYSAAAFSYILLNRPIAFVLSDIDDYKPGFLIENYKDVLVGDKLYTDSDFKEFVMKVAHSVDEYRNDREQLLYKLYADVDGRSSERLADFLKL